MLYTVITIAKFKRKKLTELIKLLVQQRIKSVKKDKPILFIGFSFFLLK